MSTPRVMVYVQHLLGIGHFQRALVLARACAAAGLETHLVSGGLPVPGLASGGVHLHQLAPARCAGGGDWRLRNETGALVDDAWRDRRREQLMALFRTLRPAALVVELFPFGRRQMRYELLPLLQAAQAADPRPRLICSVRDILQSQTKHERAQEAVTQAQTYFDDILVHGDADLIALPESFPAAAALGERLRYTGYVVEAVSEAGSVPGTGEVLVSAGGGAVGEALLNAAIAARPLTQLSGSVWRILTGHNLDAKALADLRARAGDDVIVEPARADFRQRLLGCALSISQAGYNTLAETLAARARAVVVPYAKDGETEQTLRATRFAELGLVRMVPEPELSTRTLAEAVNAALSDRGDDTRLAVNLSGAEASARYLVERVRAPAPA